MRWNMFGGTIGGPIKKDRLFYFGDYQGERFDNPASTGFITVFTAKERAGDFSETCETGFDATGKLEPQGNSALQPNSIS